MYGLVYANKCYRTGPLNIAKSAKITISHTEISEKVAHTIFFSKDVKKNIFRENVHRVSTYMVFSLKSAFTAYFAV